MNRIDWELFFLAAIAALWLAFFPGAVARGKRGDSSTLLVFAREVRLDPGQLGSVNSILDDARQSQRLIQDELRRVRASLIRALAESRDEDIERLNRQHTALSMRRSALESAALARIFSLLDEGQKSRAKDALGQIEGMIQGSPGNPGPSPDH